MTRPPRIRNLKDPAPAAAAGCDPVTSESTRVPTWYAEAIAWLAGTEGLVGRADDLKAAARAGELTWREAALLLADLARQLTAEEGQGRCRACGGELEAKACRLPDVRACAQCGALDLGPPGVKAWWELAGCDPRDEIEYRRVCGAGHPSERKPRRRRPRRSPAWAIVEREARELAQAAEGHQVTRLDLAVGRLGVLVATGQIAETVVTAVLTIAARAAGVPEKLAADVIRRGLAAEGPAGWTDASPGGEAG